MKEHPDYVSPDTKYMKRKRGRTLARRTKSRVLTHRYGRATDQRPTRYIAKCKACGVVTSGLSAGQDMHRSKHDPQRAGAVFTHESGSLVMSCRKCGQPRYAKLVRGKLNPRVECNDRCMSSTGTTCECSCGGKNHGGAYSA